MRPLNQIHALAHAPLIHLLMLRPQAELNALMDAMEGQAAALVDRAEFAHAKRCDVDTVGEEACGDQNYHACGTRLPNPVCNAGSEHPSCGLYCGRINDYTVSTAHFPDVLQRDQQHLSDLHKETLCWTRLLDETYLANHATNSANSAFPAAADLPLSYIGEEATGLFRDFPARYRAECGGYDPRIRPWYTTAMAPPKDTVILIDASGSMSVGGGSSKLARAIEAAEYMISRFASSDAFAILAFGTNVRAVYPGGGGFARGGESDKTNAGGAMAADDATASVGPSWDGAAAFDAAFDLLSTGSGSTGCRKSIVLLTDNSNSATEYAVPPPPPPPARALPQTYHHPRALSFPTLVSSSFCTGLRASSQRSRRGTIPQSRCPSSRTPSAKAHR